ncbi:MAG: hypothetical protein JNM44_07340, partial [Chitinophagaceae bacterium]|nr:hypothetical protein [Chitinophagaceae bacterium]
MKTILLVLCMLLNFHNLQAQVDDEDPYLSPLYLSVIYQFSKLNSTNVGLALQGYLLDGRIQLSGSFAHSFYPVDYLMPDNASDFFRNLKYLNGAEIAGNPNGMFYETEFGIVYNFKRSVKTTNSRIPLFSTGTRDFHTTYYTRGDVSSIKMSGIRFGWGQYRRPTIEPMNGYKLEPNPPVTDPTVITLVTERYFNLGVQSTRVVNYAVEGGLPERRAT